ncbi:DUF86 domain-containing protein [Candidatus Bathyarchaeota archaeon]|nr:DUF86 domain-containing protein [Candidatus Bathyarchaeota archaeon]
MSSIRADRLLEEIEGSLKVAEKIVRMDFNSFISDVRNRYTLRLALVEIVEASVTLGLYILRERFDVEAVEGYVQVFRKLMEHGVISPNVEIGMERLTRLRNMIIHRYWEADDARIYREAGGSGLMIIRRFVEEVEGYASRA